MTDSISVEERLQIIYDYSQVYKNFFQESKELSRLDLFVQRLNTLDTSTVYPVLLFLFGDEAVINPVERDNILIDLESYLIRRLICRLSSKNYNRIFLTLLRNLRYAEIIDRVTVRQLLLDLKGDNVRWPDDAEFGRAWMVNPLYQWLSQKRVRMILEAVELELVTGKQEQLHIKDSLSIEHVYPQTPQRNDWPPLEQESLIHTVGNLTLLTQKLNSSISNGPFSNKRSEIARQSRLRLNAYFQDYSDASIWSATDIVQRGAELYKVARNVWVYPTPEDAQPQLVVETIVNEIASADEYNDDPIAQEEYRATVDNGLHQDVYEYLKQVARDEQTVTYSEIALILGLNMQSQLHRNELGEVLGAISTYEYSQGRPLLSVVTVFTNEGSPSNGFFNLARDLGKFNGSTEMEKLKFFATELKAVHRYWKNEDQS